MKVRIVLFCLPWLIIGPVWAQKYKYPMGKLEEKQFLRKSEEIKNFKSIELLKTVKYYMINGQLERAKILLKEATVTTDFSRTIQYRYLAMIYFIEGNHEKVIDILNSADMSVFTAQSKYCQLNILSHIILNKTVNLNQKWADCAKVTSIHSPTNLTWMQTIVDLKLKKPNEVIKETFKNLGIENLNGDFLRIYLKLALYLGQQDKVIPRFQYLNANVLSDQMFRELIGMNYYRNNEIIKAFDLMENLDTPNAEVFKGNLYLFQKKFDAAFAQYKLALTKKDNSDNALERLIPLAWQLGRYEEGINYIQRFSFSPAEVLKKYTLLAAFNTLADKKEQVKRYIRFILKKTNKSVPIELNQIMAYNSILYKQDFESIEAAMNSCLKKDGLNCWYLFFHESWVDPTEKLQAKDTLHSETEPLFETYSKTVLNEPIQEEIFVQQKDVEELDNDLIELIEK